MRLEAVAKGGYYRTPDTVTDLLCGLVTRPARGRAWALDPCAGEGLALAQLGAALDAETWGVELNEERAATAARRLDHVLCADALGMRASHGVFTISLLNPPYHQDEEDRRLEHAFLKKTTPYLAPGGVLVFIIPQRRLAVSAKYLASWYEGIGVFRFPDGEVEAFDQLVVLAARKLEPDPAPAVAARLVAMSEAPLPALAPGCCTPYAVPAGRGATPRIEAGDFDARMAARVARTKGLWADRTVAARLWPSAPERVQPLMPLKKGHVAQFGVAGLLDNVVLADDLGRPHVVKGRAVKETVVAVQEDEEGTTRIERDVIKTSLSLLDVESARFIEVGAASGEGSPDGGPLGSPAAMALPQFLEQFRGGITARILADYTPLYTPAQRALFADRLALLRRRPRGAQADVIRATALALSLGRRGVLVSGEMGTGKTLVAAAAAYCAGKQSILVMCPPHLVKKWKREVEATIPGVRAGIAATPGDLHRILQLPRDRWTNGPLVTIISRERAKLSYAWKPAVVERLVRVGRSDGTRELKRLPSCPTCGAILRNGEGLPLEYGDLKRKRLRCQAPLGRRRGGARTEAGRLCGAPLWQADSAGPRRMALAAYIARHLRADYDLLVLDELHEVKARGSAQGHAAAALAAVIPQTVGLTGTLFGGFATSLFHLLYRLLPDVRMEYRHTDDLRWASAYGILERITREKKGDRYTEDGAQSKRRDYQTQVRERPGIMPSLIVRLVKDTAFLRLADVADDLPPYSEQVLLYTMTPEQGAAYERLRGILHAALTAALRAGSQRLLGAYLQTLLAYPDTCWRPETVTERVLTGSGELVERVLAHEDALPTDVSYPKEAGLVELVRREALAGRRCLVYVSHTEKRDVMGRLAGLFRAAGLRPAVLKADTVAPEKREEWVEQRVKEGIHCLIVHPRCVQTGLDLLSFATICYAEVEYSTYVLRQASRRSWRIGQKWPVRVYFLAYRETMQAQALALIARKLRAALLVDGELADDGLTTYADDGDFFLELARSVASGAQDTAQGSLEELFAAARATQDALAGDLVRDDQVAPLAPLALPATGARREQDGADQVLTVALSALRESFYAAGKPRHVPDAQLSLFDLPEEIA